MNREWMLNFSKAVESYQYEKALIALYNQEVEPLTLLAFYEETVIPLLDQVDSFESSDAIYKEHYRTQIIMDSICLLQPSITRYLETAGVMRSSLNVLLYAPEGETHILALRMMQDLLRIFGTQCYFTGPDMPNHQLESILRDFLPTHLIISVTNSYHLVCLKEALRAYASSLNDVVLIGTGKAFTSNINAISNITVGADFRSILRLLGVGL